MHALGPQWMDPQYLLDTYGTAFFFIALAIVFVECGLFFPILPGDTLLFSVGIFIAGGQLHDNLLVALVGLFLAAIAGNVVGYEIGRGVGSPLRNHDGRIVKRAYFDQTEEFFGRYGARALVLGRFVPVVRTYITVVAGIGRMERRHFVTWSAVGAALWVLVVTLAGYFLGNVGFVKDHLELVILGIVVLSVIPMVVEYLRHRRARGMSPEEVREGSADVVEDLGRS
ncbi:VTT domain-containing protein [Phycicoccus flavus]|nr:VTT domain-containing protein [Phycicoccus flavus]NHA70286.1 DedA family protein [Phycicoccus flavus]